MLKSLAEEDLALLQKKASGDSNRQLSHEAEFCVHSDTNATFDDRWQRAPTTLSDDPFADDFFDDALDTTDSMLRPPPPPPRPPAMTFAQRATLQQPDVFVIDLEKAIHNSSGGSGGVSSSSGSSNNRNTTKTTRSLYVGDDAGALDAFVQSVYTYYVHGGMGAFVLGKLTDLAKLIFIAALFYFTAACVDFAALVDALQQQQQTRVDGATREHVDLASFVRRGGTLPLWCYPLAIVFGIYTVVMLFRSAFEVHRMFTVRDFYHFELDLHRVHSVRWSEVVDRILASRDMQLAGIGTSPLDVVARLMRHTNYFVALVATDSLAIPRSEQTPLTRPWNALFSASSAEPHCVTVHPTMTQTLEWALQRTLFSFVFAQSTQLRPELASVVERRHANRAAAGEDTILSSHHRHRRKEISIDENDRWDALVAALASRFRTMAVLGILFSPFVLCFLLVDFLLESGQCRSQPQAMLATRHWSTEARWLFREYNELPHYFRRRLARAYRPADRFIAMFARPKTTIVARFLSYCVGSLIFVLICFGLAYDDDALTRVNIAFGRSAIWWLGVLGAVIAFLRAYVPSENAVFEPRRHLRETALHTHFMPRHWIDKEHTSTVRRDFSRFFQYRWTTTACELLSVVFTPYLLWSVLPRRADALLRFMVDNTYIDERLGPLCRYSRFRVDLDGDARYGAACSRAEQEDSDRYRWQHGKLETSFVNFMGEYPQFRPDVHNSMFLETCRSNSFGAGGNGGNGGGGGGDGSIGEKSSPNDQRDEPDESRSMNKVIADLLLPADSTRKRNL